MNGSKVAFFLSLALGAAAAAPAAFAGDEATCPMHEAHRAEAERKAKVDERGDHVMGFDHAKTTHRFTLRETGGAIEVTANDAKDSASAETIRTHLTHVAEAFRAGDFEMPHLVHGKVPPGVPALRKLKDAVTYSYEPIERGARVTLSAKGTEAIAAVHEFLKFQIEDHRTGDSTAVTKD